MTLDFSSPKSPEMSSVPQDVSRFPQLHTLWSNNEYMFIFCFSLVIKPSIFLQIFVSSLDSSAQKSPQFSSCRESELTFLLIHFSLVTRFSAPEVGFLASLESHPIICLRQITISGFPEGKRKQAAGVATLFHCGGTDSSREAQTGNFKGGALYT